jgi:phage protein D
MGAATADTVNVYAGQDFYVPGFVVLVQGEKKFKEMNDVMSISYTDSLANIDSFEMTVNNWDPDGRTSGAGAKAGDFKYSDSDTFNPWKDVEVWMGYYCNGRQDMRRMLTGEITTLTPNFPQAGSPTLTVRGLNLLHRFRTKQQTRPFFQKRDTEIAQTLVNEIAAEIRKKSTQLKLELDPADVRRNLAPHREEVMPYLLMNNQFPISFLVERARDLAYELTMTEAAEGTDRKVTLGFHPSSDVKRKTYILEWGKSLISFQPALQVANQVAELTVRGWNPQTKKPIKVTVKRSEVKGIVSPSELGVQEPDLAKKLEIVVDRPLQSEAEARMLATNQLRQIGEVLVEAKGKTVGLPDLRAGVKIEIKGLGKRFTGTYLVTGTTHSIGDSGYTTDFNARMEKL